MLEIQLIGNLGKDPEARYTESGTLVCNFNVAASVPKAGGKEETTWVEVTAWDKLAETCHQYLTKGARVFVRGTPRVETFTRKNGEAGAALKVTAQTVQFLSSKATSPSSTEATDIDEDEVPPF